MLPPLVCVFLLFSQLEVLEQLTIGSQLLLSNAQEPRTKTLLLLPYSACDLGVACVFESKETVKQHGRWHQVFISVLKT